MGRKESMPKNNLADVPWDHYTFNLGGNADLKPQLRRKVELIETEFTFCMLYPKNRRRKGHSSSHNNNNRSAPIKSRAETETEGRDPNASCKSESTYDSAEGSPIHPDAAAYRQNHHHRKYPVSSSKHPRKKGGNKNELEGNSHHQISYSSRSYR